MSTPAGGVYPRVDMSNGSSSFPEMENTVLDYWKKDNTFLASLDQRQGAQEYVFYDGPPFANGLPHYGHLLTGYVKDLIPRFQTMRGKYVGRVFGWDTHGLPAELEVEKQLGIKDRKEIEQMGLAAFNKACEESVLRYTDEWEDYVTRQARWVDFENGYKTLDPGFMESVMWAFKELYDKGLIYQGFRVLPYSWAEHTPLSNQETRLDDAYRERQDPTVTFSMPITGVKEGSTANPDLVGTQAIAWTTTPWTLPSNQALAVNPKTTYAAVKVGQEGHEDFQGQTVLLAKDLISAYAQELGSDSEVVAEYPGNELVGLTYEPAFDYFKDHPNSFQVIGADYVTTEDGTGIVHQAPAFGEDDMYATAEYGIAPVIPVDLDGKFTSLVPNYEGQLIFDANRPIINELKSRNRVLRDQTIVHSYPHSWRSGEPLIYMALPSWFVRVTEFRDRMGELNHENVEWLPEHMRDGQFGKWLAGARDWNISRNRYWGAPIPVWVSDSEEYPRTDVYGSLDELEKDFGVRPKSLHRPDIDELVRPNPDDPTGKSMMRRVPEVLDCWFESGSMPFAQKHYPFENRDWFENHNQADFVVEYSGQSRGWFYTMMVMSTALFDRAPFKRVLAHGIVLGDDGKKMSKSLQNYPDVREVFERDGADAMRWFLMNSPILSGGNLIVTEQGIREGVRQVLLPLWNAYSFLQLYASQPAQWDTSSDNVLDRYILAKLHDTVETVTEALDYNNIAVATDCLRSFADVLTNWYVRRSRDRFWAGDSGENGHPEAFNTLYTVLETITRLTAPLLPMISEVIWRGLTGERSVHLTDWPEADVLPKDDALVSAMDDVRSVASSASALRKANKLRNRLPLQSLTVAQDNVEQLEPFTDILRDEVNVKDVHLTQDIDSVGKIEVVVNARNAGPRLGENVQKAIKGVKSGNYTLNDDDTVSVDGLTLEGDEFSQKLVAKNPESTAQIPGTNGLVMIDTQITPELEAEGWAADRVRALQDARKQAGLDVSDRIKVTLNVPSDLLDWAHTHADDIAREVLAVDMTILEDSEQDTDLGDGCTGHIEKA